jgi:hypothetical protein
MIAGPYRLAYDARRVRTSETHADWTKLHSHNDALRIMTKKLIADLWSAWRQAKARTKPNIALSAVPNAESHYTPETHPSCASAVQKTTVCLNPRIDVSPAPTISPPAMRALLPMNPLPEATQAEQRARQPTLSNEPVPDARLLG